MRLWHRLDGLPVKNQCVLAGRAGLITNISVTVNNRLTEKREAAESSTPNSWHGRLLATGGPGRVRSALWMILKVAITATILARVLQKVDLTSLGEALKTASAPLIMLSVGFLLLSPILGGLRWWMVLRATGVRETVSRLAACYWIGNLFSQVLPAVAGDGVRIWIAAQGGPPLKALIYGVLLERAFMLGTLAVVVVATEPLLLHRVGQAVPPWIAPALLAAGAIGLGMLLIADRWPAWLGRLWPVRSLAMVAVDARRVAFSKWAMPLFLLSVVANLNFVFAAGALGAALKINLTVVDYLAFMPWVIVSMVLPISIGGWGVREGLLVALLGSVGESAESALVFSLSFGACIMISSLPGLHFWWLNPSRKLSRAAPSPDCGSSCNALLLRSKNHDSTP